MVEEKDSFESKLGRFLFSFARILVFVLVLLVGAVLFIPGIFVLQLLGGALVLAALLAVFIWLRYKKKKRSLE